MLSYGGLRGGIALALALVASGNSGIKEEVRDIVLFHSAGIAFLTIIINGSTAGCLIKFLGLNKPENEKLKVMLKILHHLRDEGDKCI